VNKFLFEKDITEKEAQETLNMKFEIEKNLKYSKDKINIKLASGSMMDAEFITQLYILKEKLRESSMLKAMDILKNTYPFFERLKELYLYLRSLETSLRLKREGSTSTLSIMDFGEKTFNETKDVMKEIRSIFLENINKSFATNLTHII
jgi:Glutamine synthetase adenylyltransferase